jgi:deoxycytidine triphosphate deaminase
MKKTFSDIRNQSITTEEDLRSTRDALLGYTFQLDSLISSEYETDDGETELEFNQRKQQEIENLKNIISSNDLLANQQQTEIDRLKDKLDEYRLLESKSRNQFVIQPNGIVLGSTIEKFNIPKNLSMDYSNKSTLARRFIDSCATIAEPSWHGHLTLEIKNNSHVPQILVIGQPIGQVLFEQLDHPTDYPYNGKYQGQSQEPTSAK